MILVYSPEGGDEQRWDLDTVKVTFAEAKAAEKAGDFRWKELAQELNEGNTSALQAALWVLRKRDEPSLRFADLEDLDVNSVGTEYGPAEKSFMRAHLENDPSLSDEEKAAAIKLLGFDDETEATAPKAKRKG